MYSVFLFSDWLFESPNLGQSDERVVNYIRKYHLTPPSTKPYVLEHPYVNPSEYWQELSTYLQLRDVSEFSRISIYTNYESNNRRCKRFRKIKMAWVFVDLGPEWILYWSWSKWWGISFKHITIRKTIWLDRSSGWTKSIYVSQITFAKQKSLDCRRMFFLYRITNEGKDLETRILFNVFPTAIYCPRMSSAPKIKFMCKVLCSQKSDDWIWYRYYACCGISRCILWNETYICICSIIKLLCHRQP